MKFVISTQYMENYGAHSEDGKFCSGNAYWKMKGGSDYIVSDLTVLTQCQLIVLVIGVHTMKSLMRYVMHTRRSMTRCLRHDRHNQVLLQST